MSHTIQASTPEAYQLLHEGSLALADVERNGIKIDLDYLDGAIRDTEQRLLETADELQQDEVFKLWRRRFGGKTKLGDYAQIAAVIYDDLGVECTQWTSGGKTGKRKRRKADKSVTEKVDHPFVKKWVDWQKRRKAKSTYLVGLRNEIVEGFVHAIFNLHLVETWRSSADSPNVQNIPAREPEFAKMIRRSYVARGKNRVILEVDLSQIEVRCAACYNCDPVLINYVSGGGDMHFDMAMECYLLRPEQVKACPGARQAAKNQYVFPSFYGSYYAQTAPGLWDYIARNDLRLPDGRTLYQHLETKGIRELGDCVPGQRPRAGTFEAHIQEVERGFWGNRFQVYDSWKKRWFREYQENGGFRLFTGFWCEGVMAKNEAINTPIQGVAFHVLLWALTRLNAWLKKHKMKSVIIGQIHDSMLIDCPESELEDVMVAARYFLTEAVRKHWDWIIVPLDAEAKVSPPGGAWSQIEKVPFPQTA